MRRAVARIGFGVAALALASACRRGAATRQTGSWQPPPPIVVGAVGFARPAAIVHSPDDDVYFVSNSNGDPSAADDNGFISVVSERGDTLALKWIDGASPDVELHAPTGMAVTAAGLFVADRTVIRRFDVKTRASAGNVAIPGATSLQGMASTPDGMIYVTDSGLTPATGSPEATGTDAVYRIRPDRRIDTLGFGKELGHPVAVAVTGDSVWVVSRAGELYRLVDRRRQDVVKLPSGGITGLVVYAGDAFVASEEANAILRGPLRGPFGVLLSGLDGPGIIGHDIWRNRILVPLPEKNELRIVRLAF